MMHITLILQRKNGEAIRVSAPHDKVAHANMVVHQGIHYFFQAARRLVGEATFLECEAPVVVEV